MVIEDTAYRTHLCAIYYCSYKALLQSYNPVR